MNVVAAPQVNIAQQIDRLFNIREAKRELAEEMKLLDEQYAAVEAALIEALNGQGIPSARSTLATATVTSAVMPNVKDWTAFHEYIRDHDALYLLERRPSVVACRELFQAGETLPGVEPYEKVGLSLTKLRVTKSAK